MNQAGQLPVPPPAVFAESTNERLVFFRQNPRRPFYCGHKQIPLSWWFLEEMVAKIDARMNPELFLNFNKEVKNQPNRPAVVRWELQGFKIVKSNIFLSVNPIAVCVYETFSYLESMGMRNAPLVHFVVPLTEETIQNNLPKLVDRHNDILEHFALAVVAYWRAKTQRQLRLDPTRKVMERRLDMQIEANQVSNFREITHSHLRVTGWNPATKLFQGEGIELLYPNAEGMLSLGAARQVVVAIDDDEIEENDDVEDYVSAGVHQLETPFALGMWGAL
jgi:hypothetical protein